MDIDRSLTTAEHNRCVEYLLEFKRRDGRACFVSLAVGFERSP